MKKKKEKLVYDEGTVTREVISIHKLMVNIQGIPFEIVGSVTLKGNKNNFSLIGFPSEDSG